MCGVPNDVNEFLSYSPATYIQINRDGHDYMKLGSGPQ
jgi:hypothetical protein